MLARESFFKIVREEQWLGRAEAVIGHFARMVVAALLQWLSALWLRLYQMSRTQKRNNNQRDTGPRDWWQEVYRKARDVPRKTYEGQAYEKNYLARLNLLLAPSKSIWMRQARITLNFVMTQNISQRIFSLS